MSDRGVSGVCGAEAEQWQGLSVRTGDGQELGVVMGVFADGLLAGRLRVQGDYAPRWQAAPPDSTAVFAIPRRAVRRRQRDSLVLDATRTRARGRWLMHLLPRKEA